MSKELDHIVEDAEHRARPLSGNWAMLVAVVAVFWCLFQLWIASPLPFMWGWGILIDVPKRAIHLSFALVLCYLLYAGRESRRADQSVNGVDIILVLLALAVTLYIPFGYVDLVERQGLLLQVEWLGINWPVELIIGGIGLVLLMEATRRALGWPLVIVSGVFLVYSLFGQSMPDLIAHKGVSLERLVGITGWAVKPFLVFL